MKTLLSIIMLAMTAGAGCASAQTEPAHEWKVTLKVVDDTGHAVAGAEVWVNYLTNRFIGLTDTNGIFIASHTDHSVQLAFQVQKPGYYLFRIQYMLGFQYDAAKWNPTVELPLDRIVNPIPMYARYIDSEPPLNGKPVGYDFLAGDWASPDGKGQTADIIFLREYSKRSLNDYDYKLTVTFPNKGDGIQTFTEPTGQKSGGLRSPYEAPGNGYEPVVTRVNISHPPTTLIWDHDPNRIYFFRVKTVLDENGNVKSALYGKIYGDFMQFTYYLNSTPNDRNIEFDPKHNLMTLKPREIPISAP